MIYGNYFLEQLTKEDIKKYRQKMNHFSKLNGEKLHSRLSVNSKDGSSYMKIGSKEAKQFNPPDPRSFIDNDTYLISDFHFGKYNTTYDKANIDRINRLPKNANLLILGDIGYMKKPVKEYLLDIFKYQIRPDINIYLILGNHDCFEIEYYYSIGIKGVYDRIIIPEKGWVFSHQPCDGDKIASYINFHGHIHEENKYNDQVSRFDNKINCWEGYCKKNIRTISQWIKYDKNYPKDKQWGD